MTDILYKNMVIYLPNMIAIFHLNFYDESLRIFSDIRELYRLLS